MPRDIRNRRPEILSQSDAEALAKHILNLAGESAAETIVSSSVYGGTSFAVGDARMAREQVALQVQIIVRGATVSTRRMDDDALKFAIAEAKRTAEQLRLRNEPFPLRGRVEAGPRPKLYFDATAAALAPEVRAGFFQRALDTTEARELIGAGYVGAMRRSSIRMNTAGLSIYSAKTFGEVSLTARTKDGTGSGWAWSGFEDWSRVTPEAVMARAVDLGERSRHPVAVEPGRYTVILEPAAVASLFGAVLNWSAFLADRGETVYSKDPIGTNKIGLRMLDARLSLISDPWDPDLPEDTIDEGGDPVKRVVWFERGILRELNYDRGYARERNREPTYSGGNSVRLTADGDPQTREEMIASTKRGIWVNRLDNVVFANGRTGLLTGTTRDGTFLIENGKITKPIKNFRFNESPFFVLNKLDAFGQPERASSNMVVPRLKVRDFDFTSLTDAV